MSTSETRAVLVGIVVVALVGLAALARWYRNRRLNARDDEMEAWPETALLPVRETHLPGQAGGDHRPGHDRVERPGAVVPDLPVPDVSPLALDGDEAQLDDEWADQLAAMNAEHLNLIDHLERVHPAEPCQEWCCWERRLEAQRAAWLELVRADVTVVAEWIVAGTPGRWVPSAAGWPSDDWRGEMIPA